MQAIAELPDALAKSEELAGGLVGRRPAVFCDYDGTLTPIVDRPQDARISPQMRDAVRRLAARCPVCVVSGRDRRDVQELMGVDDLVVTALDEVAIEALDRGSLERASMV